MSMTGGISFYEKNKALFADGATCAASSNTADQNLCLGTNKYFQWISSGSNDATTETLTITLPAAVAIDRLFLVGMNFKAFQVQYGASLDFANVVGFDSYSANNISVTGFARDTAYFEFDEVTTDTIIITIDTTQVVNAQKYINQVIATTEIGTLVGYPDMNGISLDRNDQVQKAISGRAHVEKGYESIDFKLNLRTYPGQADIDLLDGLHSREEPFLAWLCGGLPDQFTYELRGFRARDIYQVKVDKGIDNSYYNNIYVAGVEQSYSFREVV